MINTYLNEKLHGMNEKGSSIKNLPNLVFMKDIDYEIVNEYIEEYYKIVSQTDELKLRNAECIHFFVPCDNMRLLDELDEINGITNLNNYILGLLVFDFKFWIDTCGCDLSVLREFLLENEKNIRYVLINVDKYLLEDLRKLKLVNEEFIFYPEIKESIQQIGFHK